MQEILVINLFKDFLSDYKHIIHQQVNEAFVDGGEKYVKILNSANGKHIYSTVTNPFIFLRDYQRLIAANKYIYGIIRAAVEDFTTKEKLQKGTKMSLCFVKSIRSFETGL